MHSNLRLPVGFSIIASVVASVAHAAPVSYTLDSSQSILSVSGVLQEVAASMTEQAPGSLSTTYSGVIQADLGAGAIEFLGGALTAANSGSWEPDHNGLPGDAPANYGGEIDLTLALLTGAVRGFSIQTVAGSEPIVGDQFPAPSIQILSGVMDFLLVGLATDAGQQPFDTNTYANTAGPASLTSNGVTETLTIPVFAQTSIPASGFTLLVDITGTLVGTRPVPEPATSLLLAAGALVALKRKRSPES